MSGMVFERIPAIDRALTGFHQKLLDKFYEGIGNKDFVVVQEGDATLKATFPWKAPGIEVTVTLNMAIPEFMARKRTEGMRGECICLLRDFATECLETAAS